MARRQSPAGGTTPLSSELQADIELFPEQPQRERLHVVRLDLGDADKLVPAPVSGIASKEESDVAARCLRSRGLGDVGLEVPARPAKLDDARAEVVVVREHVDRQLVGERLEVAPIDAPVREERLREEREVAEGAVAFHDEKPVERALRPRALERAHAADPVEGEGLLPPMLARHDGVAGVNYADALAAPDVLEGFERGEASERAPVAHEEDFVLLGEVAEEDLRARAVVHAEVEVGHLAPHAVVQRGDGLEGGGVGTGVDHEEAMVSAINDERPRHSKSASASSNLAAPPALDQRRLETRPEAAVGDCQHRPMKFREAAEPLRRFARPSNPDRRGLASHLPEADGQHPRNQRDAHCPKFGGVSSISPRSGDVMISRSGSNSFADCTARGAGLAATMPLAEASAISAAGGRSCPSIPAASSASPTNTATSTPSACPSSEGPPHH